MTVVPDPKDGNFLFGGGAQRCDQNLNVMASLGGTLPAADPSDPERKTWSLPEVFSPADEALYYSNQFVFRTRDPRTHVGEDQPRPGARASGGAEDARPGYRKGYRPADDGSIRSRVYDLAVAARRARMVWVGTDDGLIHVTTNDGAEVAGM